MENANGYQLEKEDDPAKEKGKNCEGELKTQGHLMDMRELMGQTVLNAPEKPGGVIGDVRWTELNGGLW